MYVKKFLATRLYTTLKLMNFKMAKGTTLSEHLDRFNLLIVELASLNEKVDEEKKALHLLTSLPKSYEHLVQTILYGKDTLTFDETIATLLSDDVRKKIHVGSSSSSLSALAVT
ncbi:unnamed protein product [Calypogeia fissa]